METQKILVPIDFTPESDVAIDMALAYCYAVKAELYMLNVVEKAPKTYADMDKLNADLLDRMKGLVISAVERAAKAGHTHAVEDVYRRISAGKAWHEILKMAGDLNADMIVMGHHPKGSTWKKVLEKAPCTVVLAREKDVEFVLT